MADFSYRSNSPIAVAVGLVGLFLVFNGGGQEFPDTEILRLYSGSGAIEVISPDKSVKNISPAELHDTSMVVRKGDMIRTGKGSYAVLLKGDRIGMRLGSDSTIDTQPDAKVGHSLSLLKGKLNVKVRPRKDKTPKQDFRLKMPTMILAVKGTSFFGEVTEGLETGGVNEGRIEAVRQIGEEERKAALIAGNTLMLNGNGGARVRKLSREEVRYAPIYEGLEKALDDKMKRSERGFVELIWVPAGSFTMGSPMGEAGRNAVAETQVKVELTQGFWLGKYEVTQEEYEEVMGTNPASYKNSGKTAPVETISWQDAMDFCQTLTERERAAGSLPEGWGYTLPTDAQWEYACRAGTTTSYSFGDVPAQLGEYGWFNANSGNVPHPVGQKKPNPWGFYDMHGNVFEWVLDWHSDSLEGGKDPLGPATGMMQVRRGGCYDFPVAECRSAARKAFMPSRRFARIGFRPALVPINSDG